MDIAYDCCGRSHTGYLARPADGGNKPGILVIHGGGGLVRHARERSDLLAALGYVAFAADLFGHAVDGLEHAQALTGQLTEDWQDMRARADAALRVLLAQPDVDRGRLAAIGFCFGGQVALELARSGAALGAVVGFHSELVTRRPADTANIRGKVLVCLGDRDRFVSADERDSFLAQMTDANIDCQMLLFAGIQHSFTDRCAEASGVPGLKYDADADRRSWAAMQALLDEVFA
jgi:dienelactone hydrolase